MKKIKNDFPQILEDYFNNYITLERRFSTNTYQTYLMVIKQYINYLVDKCKISKTIISINDFSKDNILLFLNYVEKETSCSSKTRNHKLSILIAFLEYASSSNPIYLNIYVQAKSIKQKRIVNKKMDFLTIEEMKSFFSAIKLKHKYGYKHYVLLTVLYETGTRVSELINIKINDLVLLGTGTNIRILGKGNKERIVYISDSVVKMINEYIDKFKIYEGYLFLNHSNNKYSRSGINKLIEKYTNIAKIGCKTMKEKIITPHTFRHSKAVHFLQNGTALPIIQRFLGHSSIQTTEIYLDITNDVVIDAVKASSNLINEGKITKPLWVGDDELSKLIESLK